MRAKISTYNHIRTSLSQDYWTGINSQRTWICSMYILSLEMDFPYNFTQNRFLLIIAHRASNASYLIQTIWFKHLRCVAVQSKTLMANHFNSYHAKVCATASIKSNHSKRLRYFRLWSEEIAWKKIKFMQKSSHWKNINIDFKRFDRSEYQSQNQVIPTKKKKFLKSCQLTKNLNSSKITMENSILFSENTFSISNNFA